ncbi:uroporphyrinogen-III synthase [Paracoccus tegillarcae]|uniref:Uroporphyrinogen-III synthase n=1 Tax=Paracoccus tegillarcae TaxID=1529068 RepID=A0A2K9ES90_9RHOB|nr:uroporphyrinogen-III synthase [Paracoccus tegillarcae]AUH33676.1 uroporphyrinogen-III synthase [Paracoccus tegillarcae]
MPSAAPRATVLLTRPEADSQRFAAMLPDVPVLISPILRIIPVPHDPTRLDQAAGFVFTSSHAVAAAGPGRGRTALAVGPRTAAAARDAGFDVTEGPGDAQGLLPLIAASPVPLIYPRGRHIAQMLTVEDVVVYDQEAAPLTDKALQLLAGSTPVILPLFSARSARLLSDAMPARPKAPLRLAAISKSALEGWGREAAAVELARRPDADGMKETVTRLLLWEQ